jgi:CheY-like chemotaxis protein
VSGDQATEIVILFSDRRPMRLRGIVSEAIATKTVSQILRYRGRTLTFAGRTIPTDTAVSLAVVKDGEGPPWAEVIDVTKRSGHQHLALKDADAAGEPVMHTRDQPPRMAASAPQGSARSVAPPPHILHIDDAENDRDLFARAFARSGLAGVLCSVSSAAEAMNYLNGTGPYHGAPRPKLIVLDLGLPRFDGLDLLDVLRSHSSFSTIPVVILSGSENLKHMQRCRDLGIDDYMVKPRTQQELIELIASLDHWLVGSASDLPASRLDP